MVVKLDAVIIVIDFNIRVQFEYLSLEKLMEVDPGYAFISIASNPASVLLATK